MVAVFGARVSSVRLRRHCRNTGVGVAVGALGLEAARLHSTESGLQKWRQWRRKILTLGEGFTTQVVTLWCFNTVQCTSQRRLVRLGGDYY
jgi:hypothetical protein